MDNPRPTVETAAVDTHCHLFLMEEEAAAVVADARRAGVGRMICVGVDSESSRRSLELAESLPGVFATAGVHPHDASEFDVTAGTSVEELLAHPLVVGVGETGLDHYRRLSPEEDQERAFRTHIALSREFGKPLVVHVREAWPDAMRILDEEAAERVVLHCFTGDEAIAREAEARGYHMSFAGNLTYPGADHIRASAVAVSIDRIIVETDSPFLPPQSMRGQRNRPSNVRATLQTLSELRGLDFDLMVRHTSENAAIAFPFLG
jgi:TatD DNase family protein